jgi:HD-like signal output (HDOD) protein
MKETWQTSCRVAALCHLLATLTPGIQPDRALLAGMVHNIGLLPLYIYLDNYPDLLADRDRLRGVIGKIQGRLGSALLRHWGFDNALIIIPEQSGKFARQHQGDIDELDLVLVARAHLLLGRSEHYTWEWLAALPAWQRMGISRLGREASLQLIDEANEEMQQMISALRG